MYNLWQSKEQEVFAELQKFEKQELKIHLRLFEKWKTPKREIHMGHENASVQIEVDLCGRRKKWLTNRVNPVRR